MSAWNVDRRPERFSRHWYDVASLDKTTYVASALADRASRDAWQTTRRCSFVRETGTATLSTTTRRSGVSVCGFMGFGFARFPGATR